MMHTSVLTGSELLDMPLNIQPLRPDEPARSNPKAGFVVSGMASPRAGGATGPFPGVRPLAERRRASSCKSDLKQDFELREQMAVHAVTLDRAKPCQS